ncbi:MAG: DinB family protein [Desulfobacterales bacterium]
MAHDIKQSFLNLARYNERVNREMYEVLSVLTGRARKREAGSWFGSIHGILNHLIICDLNWLKRYRALSPESPVLTDPRLDPPNLSWDHDLHDNFAGLREDRRIVDERIRAWFVEFPVSRYDEIFEYQDSKGNRQHATAGTAFEFLFLHQTHHRGQISQILDSMGLSNNFADNFAYLKD